MEFEEEKFSLVEPGEVGSDAPYKSYEVRSNILKVADNEAERSGDPIPIDPRKPKP